MRIAVMGAGGIGSFIGGLLARSGAQVTLVCRGAHLAAIRQGGLRIDTPTAQLAVEIAATAEPSQVGVADVVIQTVKLYDLAESARGMLPMVGPRTRVLSLQNGVTAAEEIAGVIGAQRSVAGCVFINAHVEEPGHVVSRSRTSPLAMGAGLEKLAELCNQAGIEARISSDIRVDLWRKFVPVAALSALSCLCRQPIGPIREDAALRNLYGQAMQQVASLAAAKGVDLGADIVERMLALASTYQYDARVSMLEDLEAGKRLELEWLSGYVSREGARLGVAVPFHDIAYACLKPLAK